MLNYDAQSSTLCIKNGRFKISFAIKLAGKIISIHYSKEEYCDIKFVNKRMQKIVQSDINKQMCK